MRTGLTMALLALVASSPWWLATRAVRRRTWRAGVERRADVAGRPGLARTGAAADASVDIPVLLELLAAAVRSGAGLPRALQATGQAVGGRDGAELSRVADALRLGADWDTAWDTAGAMPWGTPPGAAVTEVSRAARPSSRLGPVRRALRGAWVDGAAPGAALRAASQELVLERRAATRTAAARLAVRLVLPLGACFLPAFVLVGLVPVLLALGLDLLAG